MSKEHSITYTKRTEQEVVTEIGRVSAQLAVSRKAWGEHYLNVENPEIPLLEKRLAELWEEKRAAFTLKSFHRRNGNGTNPNARRGQGRHHHTGSPGETGGSP